MPEGDTVWLAARRLHDALAGSTLTRSDFRVPQLATTDLSGRRVIESASRGKHLLTRIEGGLTLHTHLRMDGSWHLYRPGERWRGGPDWQVRVVLETTDRRAVGYRLPVVELVETDAEAEVIGHLGPDLLGPVWEGDPANGRAVEAAVADGFWVEAEALRRVRAQPDRSIGEALLDQRNLAGIGTLYRAETLFLRGIHPRLPVAAVADLPKLLQLSRRLLVANRERVDQVTTGDRRKGQQHWVFGRDRQPCRRCGTRVELEEFGPPGQERRSFWCPRCQPAG